MNARVISVKKGELSAIVKIAIWVFIFILLIAGVYWLFGRITGSN